MKFANFRAILAASTCLIALSPAYAQDAAPDQEVNQATAPTAEEEQGGLAEIVVTANRRAQNLQDVPIAISAITAEMAETLGISGNENLAELVPGFMFQRQAQGAMPFIRGVGTTSTFVGNEPSTAIFMDDVYITSGTAAVFDYSGIEAVEVLKGPQGTLFGRNATGGVVHVRTKKPSFDPTVDAEIGYGNYDTLRGKFYGSAGLTDKIAINLSAFYEDQNDGWGKNYSGTPVALDGTDAFTNEAYGIRSKILFAPDETTEIILTGSYNRRDSDQGFALRPTPGTTGFAAFNPAAVGAGFYDGTVNFTGGYTTRYTQFSGKLSKEFDPFTLVVIGSYAKLEVPSSNIDIDATPTRRNDADTDYGSQSYTYEVQFLSPDDSRLKWIVGAFYLYDDAFFNGFFRGSASNVIPVPVAGIATKNLHLHNEQKTNSYAVFGQATLPVTDRFNITAGLRYTIDDRSQLNGYYDVLSADVATLDQALITGPRLSDSKTFKKLTGRISLDYKITDDLMIYGGFNRGFKSGVYNLAGISFGTNVALPPAEPEGLDAWSLGFKSQFADNRIRLNAEVFHYDYTNIQVQNNNPAGAGTILSNGGKAKIKGFDAELTAEPADNLTISAGIAVLDGEYKLFNNGPVTFPEPPNAPRAVPAGCVTPLGPLAPGVYPGPTGLNPGTFLQCQLAGNDTVMTAPITTNLSMNYRIPTSVGQFDVSGSWSHGGDYFFEPDNTVYVHQPKYDLFNASLRWTAANENFSIRLWGNNLTKEKYYSYMATGGSALKSSPAAPRTYGVTAGVKF